MKKGSHLTDEVKAKISQSVKARIADGSREEYLFAEWLDSQGIAWEYQPIVFKMPDGFNYIPDFRLSESDKIFVEVKGYLKPLDIEKMNEFVKAGNILYYVDKQFFGVRGKNMLNNFQFNEKNLWTSRRS
jgi:predicted nuclease of restriction endonuclease-like RecB superfamily